VIGPASTLAERVQSFSASQTGAVLTSWTGVARNAPQLIWYDRSGKQIGTLGTPVPHGNAHNSPDGMMVTAEIYDPQISETDPDVWLYDVARGGKNTFYGKARNDKRPLLVTRWEGHGIG